MKVFTRASLNKNLRKKNKNKSRVEIQGLDRREETFSYRCLKAKYLPTYLYLERRRVLSWTWNDIGGRYINKKHSEMPFRALVNKLSLVFIRLLLVSLYFILFRCSLSRVA